MFSAVKQPPQSRVAVPPFIWTLSSITQQTDKYTFSLETRMEISVAQCQWATPLRTHTHTPSLSNDTLTAAKEEKN